MHNQIPNLAGLWEYQVSVIRRNSPYETPDVDNVIVNQPEIIEINQNGEFLVATLPASPTRPQPGFLLGTLTKTHTNACGKFFWTLSFSDFDDNGVFTLTISDVACDETVLELSGHYAEPGFAGMSPAQLQTAGVIKLRRVLLTETQY